jgi:hypothetical protein
VGGIKMYYEINVSLNGTHFFATHKRSLVGDGKMNKVVSVFLEKFPEIEGYEVTVARYETRGTEIKI